MSIESKELLKKLEALNNNIDILSKVTAINIGRENFFRKKKTKEQQIEALDEIGLPRTIIALIVGSTPESVSTFLSQKKPKARATPKVETAEQKT